MAGIAHYIDMLMVDSKTGSRAGIGVTRDEFANAYERGFAGTVRILCAVGVRRRSDADELAQAAWARGWERCASIIDPRRITQWVNAIAINMFRNLRRGGRRYEVLGEIPCAPQMFTASCVRQMLEKCDRMDRGLLESFYIFGNSLEEIAAISNTTPGAMRVRLCRARKRARDQHSPLERSQSYRASTNHFEEGLPQKIR